MTEKPWGNTVYGKLVGTGMAFGLISVGLGIAVYIGSHGLAQYEKAKRGQNIQTGHTSDLKMDHYTHIVAEKRLELIGMHLSNPNLTSDSLEAVLVALAENGPWPQIKHLTTQSSD